MLVKVDVSDVSIAAGRSAKEDKERMVMAS